MAHRAPEDSTHIVTMHGWTAKHYVITAIVVLLAVGMFAYSWS